MVVPPFGFGIGDFLAIAKLTGKIASELKDNGEATSKYQDLIIELESLERTLSRLYTLEPAEHELRHLEAIRAAASACKRPLEGFLVKIEKFEKRLGTGKTKDNHFKGAGRRIQFNVAFEEDVKELRATLASHVLTINTLLMTQVLDSITTAETDQADTFENVKNLLETYAALLRDISGKQDDLSTDLDSFKDNLDLLSDKVDQLQIQGLQGPVPPNGQQDILDAIKSEIESAREKLEAGKTDAGRATEAEPAISSSFASALTITSKLFPIMLSGTMIVSAHTLASQARTISTIARKLELHIPLTEQLADQRSAGTGRTKGNAEDFRKSHSSATTDAIDFERPAIGPDPRIYKGNLQQKPLTTMCRVWEERASQSQETQVRGKHANDQRSRSCDTHLHKTVEQSEGCPDYQPWDRIWDPLIASLVQWEPTANEKSPPDIDRFVRKPPSSTSPLRDPPPTQTQDPSDSSPLSHSTTPSSSWSAATGARTYYRDLDRKGRVNKLSLSKSSRFIDDQDEYQRSTLGNSSPRSAAGGARTHYRGPDGRDRVNKLSHSESSRFINDQGPRKPSTLKNKRMSTQSLRGVSKRSE